MQFFSILLALIAINVTTFGMFFADKQRAIDGKRRIAERDLLTLAMFGGTAGAFAARSIFRHKTRKEPFSTHLMLIACLQIGGIIGWFLL